MKTTTCDWCGDDMGFEHDTREPEACNKRECQREVRNMYREEEEGRQERAAEDNYSRY